MTIGILILAQTVSMHLSVTEPSKGAVRSRRGCRRQPRWRRSTWPAGRLALLLSLDRLMTEIRVATNPTSNAIKTLNGVERSGGLRARRVLKSQRDARNSAPPVGTSPVFICPIHTGGILPVGEVSRSCNRKRDPVEASCRGSPVMCIDPDRARLKSVGLPRGLAITTYLLDARRCGGQFRRSSRQT
jgi:hypothetical protein